MKNILSNWSFMRILRLAMAIFIIFQGIETAQWLFVVTGIIFALMPIFNIGCCGTSGCNTNLYSKQNSKNQETTYTEIK